MSAYPSALAEHLGAEVTTVCTCWRLTCRDASTLGFTDHDRPLTIDGTLCAPQTGLTGSEAKQSAGLAVTTQGIEGALASAEIDASDIAAGRYDSAVVETFLVNWRKPQDFALLRRASVAKITRLDGRFIAELESMTAALDKPNGRHIARACDAELGDGRCGVNLASPAYAGSGAVTRIAGHDTVVVSGLDGFAADWFAAGKLNWTTGASAGMVDVVVLDRTVGSERQLTLRQDVRLPAAVSDTFAVVAGCAKQFATCKTKFANPVNFRGFPHLPGNDAAYRYATEDGDHDGGPVVP